jgi:hypothetical protein
MAQSCVAGDTHRREILQLAGAVYRLRHIELQHRLATRDTAKRQEAQPGVALGGDPGEVVARLIAAKKVRADHAEQVLAELRAGR